MEIKDIFNYGEVRTLQNGERFVKVRLGDSSFEFAINGGSLEALHTDVFEKDEIKALLRSLPNIDMPVALVIELTGADDFPQDEFLIAADKNWSIVI